MKEPNFDNEKPIMATDFTAKANKIIDELNKTVFNFDKSELYEEVRGDTRKRTTKIAEVMPTLTATKVSCKLNSLFFLFPPINEPKEVCDEDYTVAFVEFMRIMTHINDFVIMTANKQLFCGFVGITVDDYNEMVANPNDLTFRRINDTLVSTDLVSAESGLVDAKAVISKMEAKDIGHSMTKAEQSITVINNNKIDKALITESLAKFQGMLPSKK